jgi:molecular chaperone DnaJ
MGKDYYKILGVEKNASEEDIKRAYRKLAHEHHPDKPSGNADKFKEINEAYQVLSDKTKRANYDRFGASGAQQGFGGGAQGFPGGFDFSGFQNGAGGFNGQFDINDILENFFGGGVGFGGGAQTRQTRGGDLETRHRITLEEAFSGTEIELYIKTQVECTNCGGKGAEKDSKLITCSICSGRGQVREMTRTMFGTFAQNKLCKHCHGRGQVPEKSCHICKGSGRTPGERKVKFKIPAGVDDGVVLKASHMGEAGQWGSPAGDLYVKISIQPHRFYVRAGDDLVVRQEIGVKELLLGKKIEVPTIDGGLVMEEIPPGTDLKVPFRIRGYGMPRMSSRGRGDLLVDFIIKAPKKASGKLREALENE